MADICVNRTPGPPDRTRLDPCQRFVVLERGRIVKLGTHAGLGEAGGYQAELSQKQMLEDELAG